MAHTKTRSARREIARNRVTDDRNKTAVLGCCCPSGALKGTRLNVRDAGNLQLACGCWFARPTDRSFGRLGVRTIVRYHRDVREC